MFNDLTSLGYGLITFAIVIGVGTLVLFNMGGSVATCSAPSGSACGLTGVFNYSTGVCSNATNTNCATPSGTAYTNINYANTQLGQSGLAGWTPAVIAISVGLLFLGAFMVRGGRRQ